MSIDPEVFRVGDGKLFLNYSKGVQKRWLADIPDNIARVETNWPRLEDTPPY